MSNIFKLNDAQERKKMQDRIEELEKQNRVYAKAVDIYRQIMDTQDRTIGKMRTEATSRHESLSKSLKTALDAARSWMDEARRFRIHRDEALRYVAKGSNPNGFTFGDGTELACGQECEYTEDMVRFWSQSFPILMQALNDVECDAFTREQVIATINEARDQIRQLHVIWEVDGVIEL